jgi:DNA-binding NtrC family response regulator
VYHRLNVLPLRLPALREHPEDIPLIASHLLAKHCDRLDKPFKKLFPGLLESFMAAEWSGNVREMENLLLQGILFSTGEEILPADVGWKQPAKTAGATARPDLTQKGYRVAKEATLREFNHAYIGRLLKTTGGNVTQAARACGLERQALQQIMRRYGIKADDYRSQEKSDTHRSG